MGNWLAAALDAMSWGHLGAPRTRRKGNKKTKTKNLALERPEGRSTPTL